MGMIQLGELHKRAARNKTEAEAALQQVMNDRLAEVVPQFIDVTNNQIVNPRSVDTQDMERLLVLGQIRFGNMDLSRQICTLLPDANLMVREVSKQADNQLIQVDHKLNTHSFFLVFGFEYSPEHVVFTSVPGDDSNMTLMSYSDYETLLLSREPDIMPIIINADQLLSRCALGNKQSKQGTLDQTPATEHC
jgi:hypothetical protein